MRWLLFMLALIPGSAQADTLIATRTLRAQTVLTPADLALEPGTLPGALTTPEEAIGLETRVAIYAGRPLHPEELGPPAIVERNQIVPLTYRQGGLLIQTEGRALDRAGVGDTIRVMNVGSRSTVFARIAADGTAIVSTQ
ncbi:flagellar basal body P-ring formation chaperone FlgA [Sedimentimonas flavescens]|uniref:flagellar basal body P-ring formation chaperone FlgA n=1 Tax=Sedimentimonas flavescens TaxID=2851012 RepID=UPI0021A418B4|nr:flagellar basal body P-ring formation chaperone FlgA [Sedimentimonas flavescens]MCT2539775.1 flagellar basal body P-ring formation chaperone FlgA [Sedimentimonas flavescens]WBL33269.1 flagellar basal body P-ring formation chaperone FlgA [Sinirhodobacter sp. HNIBRBA609]